MINRKRKSTLIGIINRDYVYVSNSLTSAYEEKYGLYCDIYFPMHVPSPKDNGEYDYVNIFEPHEQPVYKDKPDVDSVKFYIPFLLKKENMNSPDLEFDSIFLGDYEKRPYIETSKKRELPIATKVVVYLENSKMFFFVDKKTVVNGANGNMLLRMYLAPLVEEHDEGDIQYLGDN